MKGLSYFYPKQLVPSYEIQTQLLKLQDFQSFFILYCPEFVQLYTFHLTFLTLIEAF